jgi:hypothetical protein
MKKVIWHDDYGTKHVSLLRDYDNEMLAKHGIPLDPPDLEEIFRDGAREFHNILVDRGLLEYNDIVAAQTAISQILLEVFKNKIVLAFKLKGGN